MLNEPTMEKLRGMRLGTLADAWLEQQSDADVQALGFDERMALLVDAEWIDRENKKLTRNLKQAKLRLSQAAIEDIQYDARRKLEKNVVRQLATCGWVDGKCSPRPVLTRSLRRASLPIFGGLFVREVVGQSNGVRIRDCASGGFFEVLACIHPDELCRFDQAVVDRGYFSATLGL